MKDTGGPAFPTDAYDLERQTTVREEGMTLRDYFAAKAMQKMLGSEVEAKWMLNTFNTTSVSEAAYRMADAMLKARKE